MEYIKFENFVDSTQYGYTAETTSPNKGDAKYLRITDIVPYFVDKERVPFCDIDASKIERYIVHDGDVLIARTGSVGHNLVVDDSYNNYVFASYLIRFKYNRRKLLPKYLKYVLKSPSWYGFINNYIGGSVQPGMNAKAFGKYYLPYTDISNQQRIASILSVYDSLIENNQKRIKLLEQMAENLYKEWFVRFRFPGYEKAEFEGGIPKGWETFVAEDRYDITIGKTPPRKEFEWFTANDPNAQNWLSISDMKGTFVSKTSEQLTQEAVDRFNMVVVPAKTILLSFKLTVGRLAIATEPLCTNEAIAHFKEVPQIEQEFLYQQLKAYDYWKLGNTSAIGNAINSKIVKSMKLMLPSLDIIEKFHKITSPIFETMLNLTKQNEFLTTQRDLLLPRLLSGKLSI